MAQYTDHMAFDTAPRTELSSAWNTAELIVDAESFYNRLLNSIACAEERVELEYYIFMHDALGLRFLDAIMQAAERGVEVRVMIDGVGSLADGHRVIDALRKCGAAVRVYHPLPWPLGVREKVNAVPWEQVRSQAWLARCVSWFGKINRRNHRKLCAIDRRLAYVGSFNIDANHLPKSLGGQGWRDYGLMVEGAGVMPLIDSFESLWNGQAPKRERTFMAGFLSNLSVRARRLKNAFVSRAVKKARDRVWVVNAYFLPTARLRRALLKACKNRCDVRLVLPERSDVALFPSLSSHFYRELLRAGARVYLFQPGILHAKALLTDDLAIVGSTNWNYRSTLHDLELDLLLRRHSVLGEVESAMREDMSVSRELTLDSAPRPGLVSWLLYALRYWL